MEVKPGFKTTEFWLSLLVILLGAFAASGVLVEGHWALKGAGLLLSALGAMGYGASRAKTKLGAAMATAAEKSDPT